MGRRYYITEVFAEGRYSGNQLATVIDCDGLETHEMQQIARAFNFAETTFLLGGNQDEGFDVRIFTPASELPFAGHPTLGTAYLIRHEIGHLETSNLTLNLGVGPIPVRFEDDGVVWMKQNEPMFGSQMELPAAAELLGLEASDLHPTFRPQWVSTGLEFLVIPVKNLSILKRALAVVSKSTQDVSTGMLAFCAQGYLPEHQYASRMFAPTLGVGEDAATGSATGCLAAYLVHHKFTGSDSVDAIVGQGFEIGRPSSLYMRASETHPKKEPGEDGFVVEVGGKVNVVAKGEWVL